MADSEIKNREPDATENKGCFTCENASCICDNNEEYIKKLVACITEEVMSKLGS